MPSVSSFYVLGGIFTVVFLQRFTALGCGKLAAFHFLLRQDVSQHRMPVFAVRAYVCSSLALPRNLNMSPGLRSRPGLVIPP